MGCDDKNALDPLMKNDDVKTAHRTWYLYILRLDGERFYTGITTNPERRFSEHRTGGSKAAKYVRRFKTIELVYQCEIGNRVRAMKYELKIKGLKKTAKQKIVDLNPDIDKLSELLHLNNI